MRSPPPDRYGNNRKDMNSRTADSICLQGATCLQKRQRKVSPNDAIMESYATSHRASSKRRSSKPLSRQPLAPIVNSGVEKIPIPLLRHKSGSGGRHKPLSNPGSSAFPVTTPAGVFNRVPATKPDRTAALWAKVRATKVFPVMPARGDVNIGGASVRAKPICSGLRKEQKRGAGKGAKTTALQVHADIEENVGLHGTDAEELSEVRSIPLSALDLDLEGTVTLGPGFTATTTDTKDSRITARSTNFEEFVLRPRKIILGRDNATKINPYAHFGVDAPPKGEAIDYRSLEGLDAAQIWIALDDHSIEEIIEGYEFMDRHRMCEEEYVSFATETFLKRQRRVCKLPSDRKWRAERMLQLVAPPKESFWAAPISFAEDPDDFTFNVRPDCSYWLSLVGFNEDYRSELGDAAYVHNDWITCPYFTVEFKKHGQSVTQATNQAAAAASMALYNRYLLKIKALKATGAVWAESDTAQMRHYALTFVGGEYRVWILQACLSDVNAWNGCSGRSLYNSKCTSKYAVRQLMGWINEIHRWGLSQHAASCQLDVKGILEHDLGVDVSGIDLLD